MEKPYTFTLPADYKISSCPNHAFTFPIHYAQESHWLSAGSQISEQLFDGRFAFLYYYEYWLSEPVSIPVEVTREDLHVIYPLLSEQSIFGKKEDQDFAFALSPGMGTYFYLAKGSYQLQLPAGHHLLIGFVIDAGMFRAPVIQHFKFLKPLIQAKKELSPYSAKSIDFRVGPITIKYLRIIFGRLNPHTLNNEHILLKYQIFLINLSRFKILEDEHSDLPLPERARQLLTTMIAHEGAQSRVKEIAQILHIASGTLSRAYHKHYGITIKEDRKQLLLALIEQIIVEHEKLVATAEETGFSGHSEMNRFIRNATGMTASQFKTISEQKLKP
ncbi:AraC family transcriptional regulator [Sphingobacterium sp.]|uniref:helix-turn-helix domain-containing protein n=1 Tax=Sphingobacterium sp. TaxID=341027 RepID=UPI00289A655C|nr:AraC family transcriptional regulator [Sphingobacterium sp.]